MGRQVGFYMTEADEYEFVQFIRSDRDVGILGYAMPSRDTPLLGELPAKGTPFWFSVWLWDIASGARPVVRYVPEQEYYAADPFESEIIEFFRSFLDEGRLVRGRIWAEMEYWRMEEPPVLCRKSASFRKWFERLARWIRRRSQRDELGDYVLPGAAEFARNGGQLCQAVFAKNVKFHHHSVD